MDQKEDKEKFLSKIDKLMFDLESSKLEMNKRINEVINELNKQVCLDDQDNNYKDKEDCKEDCKEDDSCCLNEREKPLQTESQEPVTITIKLIPVSVDAEKVHYWTYPYWTYPYWTYPYYPNPYWSILPLWPTPYIYNEIRYTNCLMDT